MALSLGVHKGDKIFIGDHCLEVRAITPSPDPAAGDLITVAIDGGEEMVVTDRSKSNILPGVMAFSGVGAKGTKNRLAFEAPRTFPIRRLDSRAPSADGGAAQIATDIAEPSAEHSKGIRFGPCDALSDRGSTRVRMEIVVQVGTEGGSLTIEGQHYGDTGWQFRMVRNEMALYDDCVDDKGPDDIAGFLEQTDYLGSLGEALKLFDRYPDWIDLYVIDVHPDFVDEVLAEVRSRGGTSAEARWREALGHKRRESEFTGCERISASAPESITRISRVHLLGQEVNVRVARKYERDIDLLLAEEFAVSPPFATWFLEQTSAFKGIQARVIEVGVSRSDTTGESDLVVFFEEQNACSRFALHIEDKIDAPLQPEQEARYRLRAQADIQKGLYSAFEVVLCSPKAYPLTHSEASRFDSCVHYEAVSEFLKSQSENDARSAYRAEFVATAAKRCSNGWGRTDDPVTNRFWRAAYEIAGREFPDLEMRQPKFTKGQTWVDFRPLDMPTQPRRTYISCKGSFGHVDLTFSASLARLFAPSVSAVLEKDMYVQQTGKAAAIRIEVPSFEICEPNDAVLTKVRAAFGACVRLIRFYRQNRMLLNEAAATSLPQP